MKFFEIEGWELGRCGQGLNHFPEVKKMVAKIIFQN